MKKLLISAIIGTTILVAAFSEDTPWTLEAGVGYALPFGQGLTWYTRGSYDSTGTYQSVKYTSLGNSGWEFQGKAGYNITPDLEILLGGSYLAGSDTFSSTFYESGSPYTYNHNSSWSSFRASAGLRYTFARVASWKFYGGVGPLFVVPFDLVTKETQNYSSVTYTDTISYNPGLGAYGELGAEYAVSESVGISFTVNFDKVSVALAKEVVNGSNGSSTTYTYADNPSINTSNQTASDVANSTSTAKYYTYPTDYIDLSDFGLKIGVVVHF